MKWLIVFVGFIALAHSASIYQQKRSADIPVQVVYDKPADGSVRNLEEKPQLPAEALKPTEEQQKHEEAIFNGVKNLEAKPQLSIAEELTAIKHLPIQAPVIEEATKVKIVTPDQNVEVFQPAPISQPQTVAASYQEENIDDIYDKIQEIINNGAKKIQCDFEKIPEDSKDASKNKEILKKVNATFEEFLDSTKKLIELRGVGTLKQESGSTSPPIPNPANIFQQIINQFQQFSSNLFSGLNPGGQQGLSEGTTASPSPFPFNPVEIAQNVFNQVQGNLGSLFGARPPQGTQGDETPAPANNNPLQAVQNAFNNIFNRPTAAPGAQSDETPAGNTNPVIGFVQTAIQNVQNAFQPSTAAPAQHDEVTQGITPGGPLSFFQNGAQNVISALQNNPLFPGTPSTAAPQTLGASTPASNPAIAAISQVQSQFAQIPGIPNNPFQQPAQQAIEAGVNQANQVVANLNQQGVPVPEQVNQAISQAQQAGQQISSQGSGSTVAPEAATTAAAAPAPAAEVSETPASDVPEDVVADEVKEEVLVLEVPVPVKEEPVKEEPIKEEPLKAEVEAPKEEISNEVTEEKQPEKEKDVATQPEKVVA